MLETVRVENKLRVDSKWNILQMSGHCLGSGRVPSRQPASINFAYQFWNLDVSNHSGCSLRVKCLQQAEILLHPWQSSHGNFIPQL